MSYTLTLCVGMFLGLCGQITTYDFKTLEDCRAEARLQEKRAEYAVCSIKKEK